MGQRQAGPTIVIDEPVKAVSQEHGVLCLECVGDVLQEYESEGDVLVVGRLHVAVQLGSQ